MSREITEGLALTPARFAAGLANWSSGNGTPGAASYVGAGNAAIVEDDQDFGDCLELIKTTSTQKLRAFATAPMLPGLYLRVRTRVKAVSGALPTIGISVWAGSSPSTSVGSAPTVGPTTVLASYGEVVVIEAIIGTGARGGVNLVWPSTVSHLRVGLDLTGPNGGVIRIEDFALEDISSYWLAETVARYNVKDDGAVGDGVADDRLAFTAADAAAGGAGEVFVPAGTYAIGDHLTMNAPVTFEGSVVLPTAKRLILRRNFHYLGYLGAFGGNEVEAFKRGFQALLSSADHDSFDLSGRRIDVSGPIDMQAAEGNVTSFEIRRVIRNGQFNVQNSTAWDTTVVTSTASYSAASPNLLSNVVNAANIAVGSLITGNGVGREVYVSAVNVAASTVTLSLPLFGPAGSQTYTFKRFKYVLDFSGFSRLSKFAIEQVEFQCNSKASGILLAAQGEVFQFRDSAMQKPLDRGITSHGSGCQDLHIDGSQFTSSELSVDATARTSIAFNVNANDSKIRSNRFQRFRHTGVFYGSGHLITGNHWFQGDNVTDGPRLAGVVFSYPGTKSVITGNYIDNSSIELTNEHNEHPVYNGSEYSFGGITITGNIFTANDVASWFKWIIVKPYGSGHFIQGLSVIGNAFRTLNGSIDRIEGVDTSYATLDNGRARTVVFEGNTFHGISQLTQNPVTLEFDQATATKNWVLNVGAYLPFGGWARTIPSVMAEGAITNGSNVAVYTMPYGTPNYGASGNQVLLTWSENVKGRVQVTSRMDNPV
ncbi:MAG: glycosyl hydrolase family 28-related protein [Deltaproteobacteria bacterium]